VRFASCKPADTLVRLFVCHNVRLRISQRREKDKGVKFCMRVRLLSLMSVSHFGELWLVGSHGGVITSGMYAVDI